VARPAKSSPAPSGEPNALFATACEASIPANAIGSVTSQAVLVLTTRRVYESNHSDPVTKR
jgi:hypothetical protein